LRLQVSLCRLFLIRKSNGPSAAVPRSARPGGGWHQSSALPMVPPGPKSNEGWPFVDARGQRGTKAYERVRRSREGLVCQRVSQPDECATGMPNLQV
jgi:hypothetical protein